MTSQICISTVCSRTLDPLYVLSYRIKLAKTFLTAHPIDHVIKKSDGKCTLYKKTEINKSILM